MSEPTIEDVVSSKYWEQQHNFDKLEAVAAGMVAYDTLRAVLRELEQLGGNDPFRQSLALLDIRDRIRAALGE